MKLFSYWTLNICCHSEVGGMDSESVFGSDDEMDGAVHMYQEDFKRFVIHVMELSGGKQRQL